MSLTQWNNRIFFVMYEAGNVDIIEELQMEINWK